MKYYFNPLNEDVVAADSETKKVIVCVPLFQEETAKNPSRIINGKKKRNSYPTQPPISKKTGNPRGRPESKKEDSSDIILLDAETFDEIKALQNMGDTSLAVSGQLDLPIQHVNWAFSVRDYVDYERLATRKS